jgi:hypothetical protein
VKATTFLLVGLLCVDAVTWTFYVSRVAGLAWLAVAFAVTLGARWLEQST